MIVFAGVVFMAETAKILSPASEVLVPDRDSGCSLADSLTGDDLRRLKALHPDAAVVCYINSTAEVKAESDVCVTSSNVHAIIAALPERKVLFVPDRLMGQNVRDELRRRGVDKEIITSDGTCMVHEEFGLADIAEARRTPEPVRPDYHLTDTRALVVLGNALRDERLVISQLVGIAIEHIAFATTWAVLQSTNVTEGQLATLQAQWDKIEPSRCMRGALDMERAMALATNKGQSVFGSGMALVRFFEVATPIRTPSRARRSKAGVRTHAQPAALVCAHDWSSEIARRMFGRRWPVAVVGFGAGVGELNIEAANPAAGRTCMPAPPSTSTTW